ncbi:UNVERIFIED_CONTAM: Endothelin-converting enzyme 2 [Siphonaria sp. JEL0065]|nr:Endothelin-converting enzyme 2 [Siphonaria sp. JEL0065]
MPSTDHHPPENHWAAPPPTLNAQPPVNLKYAVEVETLVEDEASSSSSSSSYSALFSPPPKGLVSPPHLHRETTPLLVGNYQAIDAQPSIIHSFLTHLKATVCALNPLQSANTRSSDLDNANSTSRNMNSDQQRFDASSWILDKWTIVKRQTIQGGQRINETWDAGMNYINERYTPDQKQYAGLLAAIVIGLYVISIVFIYNPPRSRPPVVVPPPDTDLPPPPPTDPFPPPRPPVLEPAPLCTSKDCVVASANILLSIDEYVDPCEDFYQYSCGNWIKNHPIRSTSSKETSITVMNTKNNAVLKSLLVQSKPPPPNDPTSITVFNKMKILYSSCKSHQSDSSSVSQLALHLTKAFIPKTPIIISTFPIGEPLLRATNLVELLASAQEVGLSTLFTIGVQPSPLNPSTRIPTILPWETATLGLGARSLYENETVLEVYESSIASALGVVLGNRKDWKKVAKEVVWFEKEIAKIMPPAEELFDNEESVTTLSQLQSAAPFISWTHYFRLSLATNALHSETKVSIPSLKYFSDLSTLVLKVRNTEAIDGYFLWSAVWKWGQQYGGKDVKRALGSLKLLLTGVRGDEIVGGDVWDEVCLGAVTEAMGDAVARWFIEEAFGDDSVKAADSMMESIKTSFQVALPAYKWLDMQTNAEAQKKLAAVLVTSGFDPSILDSMKLAYRYLPINPKPDSFLTNLLSAKSASTKYKLGRIDEPIDRREADYPVTSVNAAYNAGSNSIMMNAGIMQPPCFSRTQPSYLNYGACGSVMGHELTHGFDDSGRKYDASGKSRDWWTPTTAEQFNERAQCFVDQYSNYTVKGPDGKVFHVDGKLTLGENIADNGGLLRALEAWSSDRAAKGGGLRNGALPGLDEFSEEQLFFLGYGQLWCSNMRPESLRTQVLTNEHAPPEWRVNGVVSNSLDFAKAFKCPVGSKMNPIEKCKLW